MLLSAAEKHSAAVFARLFERIVLWDKTGMEIIKLLRSLISRAMAGWNEEVVQYLWTLTRMNNAETVV